MRAVVYDAYLGRLAVRDVAEPVAPRDGVVVLVGAAGLCRSDWHSWRGEDDDIASFPHVPGHEFAGTILDIGPDVTKWRVGDRVTSPFVCACGICGACTSLNQQACQDAWQPGFDGWGGFAERIALPAADVNLVRIPDELALTTAAALGCRIATAFRAVSAVGRCESGEEVVVHGCGGVGLAAVMVANALGARVTAIDPSAPARKLAARFGATTVIDPTQSTDLIADILQATHGGPQLSVEAIGSGDVCRISIESLRPRGRHVQIGLLSPQTTHDPVPMHHVIARELQVLGSYGMGAHDYPALLELIAAGRIQPELLVSRIITLEELPEAFAAIDGPTQHPGITVIIP